MKALKLLFALLLSVGSPIQLFSQNALPDKYSISAGTNLMLTNVSRDRYDFFAKNGNKIGYSINANTKYYCAPFFGVGLRYDYLRTSCNEDKIHVNYIAPDFVLRFLFNDASQDIYIGAGIGYLNYQERIYGDYSNSKGVRSNKSYCGVSLSLGYEFTITHGIDGVVKMDVITSDIYTNPNWRLFNPDDDYDDGIDHTWFRSHMTFVNIGFSLMFGK